MLQPLPSLRQLTYLLALKEHLHFGRAADACFVSQSTLSVGIAEVERLLGAQLVERSKRSVRFTGLGEDVAARAGAIVRAAEDLHAAAQGGREPLVGTVRLAAIPTVAPFLLPRLMLAAGKAWPRLTLHVREMLTGPACEALHRGAIDCVLLAQPAECGEVEAAAIGTDRLLLATRGHARRGASVAPSEIDPARLLLLEDGHCLKDHALAACALADRSPEARVVASTLHTLVQLVDADLGVTLLPEMAVTAGILTGTRVEIHALAADRAERRIALVWRKGDARARDFALLAATFRDTVGSTGAANAGKAKRS